MKGGRPLNTLSIEAIIRTAFRGLLILAGLLPLMGCMTSEMQTMRAQLDQIEARVYKLDESISQDQARTSERLRQINERFELMTTTVKEGESALRPDLAAISGQIMKIGARVDEDHDTVVSLRERVDAVEADLNRRLTAADTQASALSRQVEDLQKQVHELEGQLNGNSLQLDALNQQMSKLLKAIAQMTGEAAGYEGDTYVVVSGDTLSGIAAKTGTSTQALMELNGITDPTRLRIGQVLKIPQ